ncbi:MAG: hypothetical protein ACRDOB_09130 [Streptosporangiaceae bacterium]
MPDVEDLLRAELKRTAQTVRPEMLRPLRAPAPRRGWRPRLVPHVAAAAVIAVITVVALVAGLSASPERAVSRSAPAGLPRFYVTVGAGANGHEAEAVVRASASGQVTGTVQVPSIVQDPGFVPYADAGFVTAAADDRSFIIGAYQSPGRASPGWTLDLRLFRLRISAAGKPGRLTELAAAPVGGADFQGIALSPDGKLLAVSLISGPGIGTLEVINLVTGTVRTWTAPVTGPRYAPGAPSWADGNRMIAFTWQNIGFSGPPFAVIAGVRLLDTVAPGGNLAAAKLIVPIGSIVSALITPDGRDVLVLTVRGLISVSTTVTVQIAELQARTGRLVRVLSTQTERYDQGAYVPSGVVALLSLEPGGQYVLVQGLQFGRLDVNGPDSGRFTTLPALPAGQYVTAAAW